MKAAALLIGVCVLLVLSGCNTVEGAATDIRSAGESIGEGLDRTGKALTGKNQPEKLEEPEPEEIE